MARKQHPQSRGMKKKSRKMRAARKIKARATTLSLNTTVETMTTDTKTTASKPMKWKNSKKGTSGTFVALYPEMLDDVPENLRATPAERIAKYHEIQSAISADETYCRENNVARTGKIEVEIPWTMLDFPKDGVGREKHLNAGHVGHIVQNYDEGSWAVPVVVMRPIFDDNAEIVTVVFEVTDGHHRTRVTLERAYAHRPDELRTGLNPVKIRVAVSEVASTQDTAKSFQNNNIEGLKVAGSDNWRNMYIANVPAVVETVEMAARYGINASEPPNMRGWPRAHGKIIMTMRNVTEHNQPGVFPWIAEADVHNALRFITDPECRTVYKNQAAINTGMFFGGLCHFIAFYVRPGFIHDVGMRHLLSMPDLIANCVRIANKEMSEDLIRLTLPHVTKDMLAGREENRRYFAVAAALKRFYESQVPPPKSRSSNDGWIGCPPELRQLFHIAPQIVDAEERRHFIDELHAKISAKANRKKAREARPIVR